MTHDSDADTAPGEMAWGVTNLDDSCGPLRPHELTVVIGGRGAGVRDLVRRIAVQAARTSEVRYLACAETAARALQAMQIAHTDRERETSLDVAGWDQVQARVQTHAVASGDLAQQCGSDANLLIVDDLDAFVDLTAAAPSGAARTKATEVHWV